MSIQPVWQETLPFFDSPLVVEPAAGQLSSDAGLLPFRQLDEHLGLTRDFAAVLDDPRDPDLVEHTRLEMTRSRVYGILAGYADQNDHDTLRTDPVFKLLAGRSPDDSALASQPTLSRFENAINCPSLKRLQRVLVDQFIASFEQPPRRLTFDLDAVDDPAHGHQQLTFWHGYYDQNQYLPLFITCPDNDQFVMLSLRPGNVHASVGALDPLAGTKAVVGQPLEYLQGVWEGVTGDFRAVYDVGKATWDYGAEIVGGKRSLLEDVDTVARWTIPVYGLARHLGSDPLGQAQRDWETAKGIASEAPDKVKELYKAGKALVGDTVLNLFLDQKGGAYEQLDPSAQMIYRVLGTVFVETGIKVAEATHNPKIIGNIHGQLMMELAQQAGLSALTALTVGGASPTMALNMGRRVLSILAKLPKAAEIGKLATEFAFQALKVLRQVVTKLKEVVMKGVEAIKTIAQKGVNLVKEGAEWVAANLLSAISKFMGWKPEELAAFLRKFITGDEKAVEEIVAFCNGGCFVAGTPCWVTTPALVAVAGEPTTNFLATRLAEFDVVERAIPIEEVALGQRVAARDPWREERDSTGDDKDYFGWQVATLEVRHANGSIVDMQLMRSPEWIARNGLRVGETLDLQLTEIEVDAKALVVSIEEAPEVAPGVGAVVIGRFVTRLGSNLVRVTFEDGTELVGTSSHPLWSPVGWEWRGLGEFEPGQFVQARQGLVAVVSVERLTDRVPLYNIEIDEEHVYEVTDLGVLVHNVDRLSCIEELARLSKLEKPTVEDLEKIAELEKSLTAPGKLGANEFHGNWKLDLPPGPQRNAALKQIGDLKSGFLNNPTNPGKVAWKTGEAPVDAAGRRIFGKYNSVDNTIELYKDADLSTLAHELLHYDQAVKGNRIGRALIDTPAQRAIIERDIEWKLRQMGFTPKGKQP